jgi:hypothetical protein
LRPFRDEADRPEIVVQGVDGVVHLEAASRFTSLRTQSSGAQVFIVLLVLGVGAVTGFMVWWRRLGADQIPLGVRGVGVLGVPLGRRKEAPGPDDAYGQCKGQQAG